MGFRKALLAATVLMAPAIAQAQPVNGLYVAAGAGFNWLNNISETTYATGGSGALGVRTDYGWVILGSVGWGFGNGLRVEGEMNYRSNDVSGFSLFGLNIPGAGGTISTYGVMVNALYDIGAVQGWPVHITLGGGIGYAWNRWSNVGVTLAIGNTSGTYNYDDTAGAFAYQFIAGLSVPIRQVPGLYLTAEYRYFATLAASISGTATASIPERGVALTNLTVKPDNVNQSVLLGVRYNFGRTPPAPPPAAAPAPARSFIVFFDFNRYDLTARAREIIAQAAAAARSQQVTRIEVAGHTDTVGSAQYNLGLSQRRANSVAAELVRLGVPREAIQTAGYGFSRPLVPTGPNVREPQNRRVEIVFR